ncbi:hypothetical protein [Morganella psychrotolerans]|nr:hypothetical protein [Morganella psychrotolerans]
MLLFVNGAVYVRDVAGIAPRSRATTSTNHQPQLLCSAVHG